MARENRAKREEKRFGRDHFLQGWDSVGRVPLAPPTLNGNSLAISALNSYLIQAKERIFSSPIICINNVWEYRQTLDLERKTYCESYPGCIPPFDSVFLEWSGDDSSLHPGALIRNMNTCKELNTEKTLELSKQHDCRAYLAEFFVGPYPFGKAVFVLNHHGDFDEAHGGPIGGPYDFAMMSNNASVIEDCKYVCAIGMSTVLLAFSFMNCKNVVTRVVDPNPQYQRERKKAGKKPLLRYHVLDIEPMKQVLRTEGGIETNGLKKALHICRGHFATYTEEKPLFGHFTGTVWKSSHVRGSASEGIVSKDYRVNPPTP